MRPRGGLGPWLGWFTALVVLTGAMVAVRPRLDKAHVSLAFLLTVLGASAAGGRALGLAVAGAAFLAFNYLFLPPYHTLVIADPLDWIVLVAFSVTSVVAAQLLYRATSTADAAMQRADEVDRLAALGAETLSAAGAEEALQAIVSVIRDAIGAGRCEVYRRAAGGALVRAALARADDPTPPTPAPLDRVALPVAGDGEWVAGPDSLVRWVADGGHSAVELADGTVRLAADEDEAGAPSAHAPPTPPPGAARTALPPPVAPGVGDVRLASLRFAVRPVAARGQRWLRGLRSAVWEARAEEAGDRGMEGRLAVRALLLPLVVREHTVGVLRVASADALVLTPEQARLLVALAYYAALGVERVRLVESAERAEAERRLESLRRALLTAVSHDLRTPLTTIKGIAHEVAHGGDPAAAAIIEAEADRMDALVGDLLDLSRIQAGAVRPNIAINTVDELVGAALQRTAGALGARQVRVELPPDDVLAGRFDFMQTLRVLANLLENAAKYAPPDTLVAVRARREGRRLVITVLDRGPGVPAPERERIFEPFHRAPGTPPDVRGTGLGLSIARGLSEAQGGTVRHEPRAGGGSAFVLELPAADVAALDDGAGGLPAPPSPG